MKNITCREVVNRIVSARNPAYKAHATRKFNAYVSQQCNMTGAKPTHIIAAVKAAITRKRNQIADQKQSLRQMANNGEARPI